MLQVVASWFAQVAAGRSWGDECSKQSCRAARSYAGRAYTVTDRRYLLVNERPRSYWLSGDRGPGRNIDEVLIARDTLGTDALAGGLEAVTRRWDGHPEDPALRSGVRIRSGDRLWVNVSTMS